MRAVASTAAVLGLVTGACDSFSYDRAHHAPRVAVWHTPLHPVVGSDLVITAEAEPGGMEVRSVNVYFRVTDGSAVIGVVEDSCPGARRCTTRVPVNAMMAGKRGIYSASVQTSLVSRRSPGEYAFDIGPPATSNLMVLREPTERRGRFEVVLVRDESYATEEEFLGDAERSLYFLLGDPAWRWRDNQLGFRYVTVPGVTTNYESGQGTRCGGNPWPGMPLPRSLAGAPERGVERSVGVLHRHDGYRDCAGLGNRAGGGSRLPRSFAADGRDGRVLKHELGHALFALGDEYWEKTTTRSAPGGPAPVDCRCCDLGSLGGRPCPPGVPPCPPVRPDPTVCDPVPAVCPPIESACLHPNVFESEADCRVAASAASDHPGIEARAGRAGCRPLCGTTAAGSCPCEDDPREIWILDETLDATPRPPGSLPGEPRADVMGAYDSAEPPHGPACARCMERTFCQLWERGPGRDRTVAEANEHCGAGGR